MKQEAIRHLFVYGSLRRQARTAMARVLGARAVFEGMASVPGRLYDLGAYPGVTPAAGPDEILRGDLYRLPPSDEVLEVLDDGSVRRAWIYWYQRPPPQHGRIISGDTLDPGA